MHTVPPAHPAFGGGLTLIYASAGLSESYTYDGLDRLTDACRAGNRGQSIARTPKANKPHPKDNGWGFFLRSMPT